MRLSEAQIRQGILHPEQMVRDVALRYFCESFSDDPTIMPLAIQAIEAHGWGNAFRFSHGLASLTQTEETLLWLIGQLNRQGRPENHKDADHCYNLSSMIAKADVALLMQQEEKVLGLEGMDPKHREVVAERLRLLTLDTAACWHEMEAFCEEHKSRRYINEVNLPHAERVAEAIARDEASGERVLSLLSEKVEDSKDSPMAWMEGLAVHLAGLMRLEAAVPMLILKLMADSGDYINEECMYAFPKIGGDSTVEAICGGFSSAPWHYKLYASSALERIHGERTVSACQELLAREEDGKVRQNLMAAILHSFCSEGIEPARQFTLSGFNDLRRILVGVSTLMEVPFPEREQWKKEEEEHQEAMRRRMEELERAAAAAKTKPKTPVFENVVDPKPVQPIVSKKQVGRNDPCPCGSGKKYKKCCGK